MLKKTLVTMAMSLLIFVQSAQAGDLERRQAKRIFDRLNGTPPTDAVLDVMEQAIVDDTTPIDDPVGKGRAAAEIALQDPAFYNVTLKNWAAPWTNEEQTVFTDLNDYSATVIGLVRDGEDFRQLLYGDIFYVGNSSLPIPAYSNSNNEHYAALDAYDLSLESVLDRDSQSARTDLEFDQTAGVITSRAAAKAFFYLGTNRAMLRFTMLNHLCTDLEQIKDNSRVPNRVHQDTARSPGGDSRIYLNNCVGCHAGQDALLGAYAYYDLSFDADKDTNPTLFESSAKLTYSESFHDGHKYLINANNFPQGYKTIDDSWLNYWRQGPNSSLGWNNDYDLFAYDDTIEPDEDDNVVAIGNGAKSMGMELAHSDAFASCQVKKAFKAICLRDPDDYLADRDVAASITDAFVIGGHNMKNVFRDVAAYCKGD